MKQLKHSRGVRLVLIAMIVLLMLTLTGCSNVNPAMKHLTAEGTVDTSALSDTYKLGLFDYVKLPFSYLLRWLYDLTGNFGYALILFGLIVKILLLPASAKSKKGMMKMSRLTPQVKALEEKFGDDKAGYQKAVNELYRKEGAGGCGGCLWSLLPLLILIPLYEIIRQPITWLMFHGSVSEKTLGEIQNALLQSGAMSAKSLQGAYWQMLAMPHLGGNLAALREISPEIIAMNTRLFGIELATIPKPLFWKYGEKIGWWNAVGQLLLPLISGGVNMLSMLISQKQNNAVIVDNKGEKDEQMAKSNQTNKLMTYMMPLMSVYFGFIMPAGLSVYWIIQGLFSMVQDWFLNKHYKKIYDAEDEVKRQIAAREAEEAAKRERERAEKWAENPDGFVGSASKKKIQQRQKNEQVAKDAAWQEKKTAQQAEAQGRTEGETPAQSADNGKRPNRRGRNYDPNRYADPADPASAEDKDSSDTEEQTKE